MTQYLLVNDIHLADRPPSSCTETYLDDLFELLGQVGAEATRRLAAGVILAGDVFHSKAPGRTSHRTVIRLASLIEEQIPCPVYVVAGNHDLQHDRLESLDSQPLGVLLHTGLVYHLTGFSGRQVGLADPVYGVPWQQQWSDRTVQDALHEYRIRQDAGIPGLVVTHAPLYPPGQELPYEFYPVESWARFLSANTTVHYGHVHEPHGVYTVGGVTFSNPGALSRGSLHEHNLTRPVQIAAWHAETGAIEHITLPHRPAEQVFRLAEAADKAEQRQRYSGFLDNLAHARLEVVSIEAVHHQIQQLGVSDPLRELIGELLEGAHP